MKAISRFTTTFLLLVIITGKGYTQKEVNKNVFDHNLTMQIGPAFTGSGDMKGLQMGMGYLTEIQPILQVEGAIHMSRFRQNRPEYPNWINTASDLSFELSFYKTFFKNRTVDFTLGLGGIYRQWYFTGPDGGYIIRGQDNRLKDYRYSYNPERSSGFGYTLTLGPGVNISKMISLKALVTYQNDQTANNQLSLRIMSRFRL